MLARLVCFLAILSLAPFAKADDKPIPKDWRLQPPKDLDGYFPFAVSPNKAAWNERANFVKRQLRVSLGIFPEPTRNDLKAQVYGKIDRGNFTIERATFESLPGFYVTGSLYRPKTGGKHPAVLCPHGHWANGRFHDRSEKEVQRDIEQGAEKYLQGGRSPLQARCVHLARMGCVVFHYDMLGYADSQQLSFDLVHRFGKQRPEMNTTENWGLYSPQAEANLQSIMGLQTWNSIRAIDFMQELPDVDGTRIGVTGASGGGTQTMILAALDQRVTASFPAVMVSTAMQGGCTCENCSLLRVDTGNIEFAALFGPKPQGMTAANDWTKEMKTKGFPEIKAHYTMLGAPDEVFLENGVQFPHNYNYPSRLAMYSLMNRAFKLGAKEPIAEEDYIYSTKEELSVWDADHPAPPSGPEFEKKLLKQLTDDSAKQLASVTPKDADSLKKYREIVGNGVAAIFRRGLPEKGQVTYEEVQKEDKGKYSQMSGWLRIEPKPGLKEELSVVFLHPKNWKKQTVIWLHERGAAGLFGENGQPIAEVQKLLDADATVVGIDLIHQGASAPKPMEQNPVVKNPREFAGYTYGYNDAVLVQRTHDVLSLLAFIKNHEQPSEKIDLVASGKMAPIGAAARALGKDTVRRAAISTDGFRFGKLTDYRDLSFLPGGAKYGDLPGLLALAAPGELLLAGEGEKLPELVASAYGAAGKPDAAKAASDAKSSAPVDWLLK